MPALPPNKFQTHNKHVWLTPALVAAIYLLVGCLWILFSDRLADILVQDPLMLSKVQTLKGWFFVLVTSGLLYFLLRGHDNAQARHLADVELQRKALGQSEVFLVTLLNAIPTPVFYKDNTGRYLGINEAFEKFFGTRREELIGKTDFEVTVSELAEIDHAKDEELLGGGRVQPYESRIRDARGQPRAVIFHKAAFRDDRGRIAGLIGTIFDITHRKHTEEALRKSEESFRELFNSISDLIYTQDLEGRFMSVNRAMAQTFGYSQDELIGVKASRFMRPEYKDAFQTDYLEGLKRTGRFEGTSIYYPKDGKPRFIEYRSTLVTADTGKQYISGTGRDVTERIGAIKEKKRLEDQLRQVQKMEAVGTLAGGIAHDFNNILAAIIGYAELALNDARAGKGNARELEEILKSADRAKELVKQILTFSRKVTFKPKPLDVNKVVRDAANIISRTIPKMISLELHLDQGLRLINGDHNQIEQVLLNLANNANDAMPDGGKLTIETKNLVLENKYINRHFEVSPGRYVRVTVSDTGQGMDEDTLEHIFEPFYTTKETGKGTGLGLASVYGIVKGHGGYISCHSEPGSGTFFRIYLPALESGVESCESEKADTKMVPGGSETLLMVDDEEALRSIGSQVLGSKGYRVLTAASGEEALSILREKTTAVDLVILDLIMPGMGGGKTLKEILALQPEAKVIITSGYSANGQVQTALESGAKGYIAKPYLAPELLRTVRTVLDSCS